MVGNGSGLGEIPLPVSVDYRSVLVDVCAAGLVYWTTKTIAETMDCRPASSHAPGPSDDSQVRGPLIPYGGPASSLFPPLIASRLARPGFQRWTTPAGRHRPIPDSVCHQACALLRFKIDRWGLFRACVQNVYGPGANRSRSPWRSVHSMSHCMRRYTARSFPVAAGLLVYFSLLD